MLESDQINESGARVNVKTIYLHCWEYFESQLPSFETLLTHGDGINIQISQLTFELVDFCKKNNKILSVWTDKFYKPECEKFHEVLLNMGVDIICTDKPLELLKLQKKL